MDPSLSLDCLNVNGMHVTFLEEPTLLSDCFLFDSNDTLCDPLSFVPSNASLKYTGMSILTKYPEPQSGVNADISHACANGHIQTIRLPVGNPNQSTVVSMVTILLPLLAFIIIITSSELK